MSVSTTPLVFDCEGNSLVGIVHQPESAVRGVLIVVGGPQYRVGSHRQFVLLARDLAAAGFAVMRFDHRGIGDSGGATHDFEHIDHDIDAAIRAFRAACPTLEQIVIWGLCDAASAALFYTRSNQNEFAGHIAGLVLVNPWVHTEQGEARSYLSHYYARRVLQPSFWKKLMTGKLAILTSIRSFLHNAMAAMRPADTRKTPVNTHAAPLPDRVFRALSAWDKPVLLILSGNDLTAAEFRAHAESERWRDAVARERVHRETLADSDHTFSRRAWRDRVAQVTIDWLRQW